MGCVCGCVGVWVCVTTYPRWTPFAWRCCVCHSVLRTRSKSGRVLPVSQQPLKDEAPQPLLTVKYSYAGRPKTEPEPEPSRPADWKMRPRVAKSTLSDVLVEWDPPPAEDVDGIEYRIIVRDRPEDASYNRNGSSGKGDRSDGNGDGNGTGVGTVNGNGTGDGGDDQNAIVAMAPILLPGTTTSFLLDEFNGEPILPSEDFTVEVAFRRISDRDQPGGGWQCANAPLTIVTKDQTEPVALLRGRVPRLHLLEPPSFQPNSDEITSHEDVFHSLLTVMKKNPELRVNVQGHVNFGQKKKKAHELSLGRAKRVIALLVQGGIDKSRLQATGYGSTRPRYPRYNARAPLNRRVEFRVLDGGAGQAGAGGAGAGAHV